MKKIAALVLTFSLCLALGAAAPAEAPAAALPAETPAASPAHGPHGSGADEGHDFFAWIGQGWDLVTDAAETGWDMTADAFEAGWDMTADAFENGWDYLAEHIPAWSEKVERYMHEKQTEKRVRDAWDTLEQGALQHGQIAMDKLTEAYHTVKEWLIEADETVDQSIAEAVDRVAGAAGVAEAAAANHYRLIEHYMTEKAELVTDAAEEAWSLIIQSGAEAGSVSGEKLREAYRTVREWLVTVGEAEDSDIIRSLEELENS